jgi:hypothetical protein
MTVREEFLEILRVLVEMPQSSSKLNEQPQSPEASDKAPSKQQRTDDRCRRAS